MLFKCGSPSSMLENHLRVYANMCIQNNINQKKKSEEIKQNGWWWWGRVINLFISKWTDTHTLVKWAWRKIKTHALLVCSSYEAQVRKKYNKSESSRPIKLEFKPITVSWSVNMRQFNGCAACVILMDKVTLNRIRVWWNFPSFF